jgi:hypothetical protein
MHNIGFKPKKNLFQTFKKVYFKPKNLYFRPPKNLVLDFRKTMFPIQKKPYFKHPKKPCFKPKKNLFQKLRKPIARWHNKKGKKQNFNNFLGSSYCKVTV